MFDIALAIFLFLSPIIILPSIGSISALQFYQFGKIEPLNSAIQLQFFQFGVIALFIVSLFQKRIRETKDVWLYIFLICVVLSIFYHPKFVTIFPNIFLGFLLYKLTAEYAKNIKFILFPIVIVSILNTIFATLQFFGIQFIYSMDKDIVGLMKISSHLGFYQAIAVPICYFFNPFLAIIPLIGLLLSKCVGGTIGGAIGIIYILRNKFKELGSLWIMLILSVTAVCFIKMREEIVREFLVRIWIWKETVKELSWVGYGFTNFKIVCQKKFFDSIYIGEAFDNPYSVYLSIIHSIGILSIPIFMWIYDFLNENRNKQLFITCVILLVIGLVQSFIIFPRLVGTAIVLFGLLKLKEA